MIAFDAIVAKVSDPIACGRDDHDLEHDNRAFWEASVRTILEMLREPELIPGYAGRLSDMRWRSMVDDILFRFA